MAVSLTFTAQVFGDTRAEILDGARAVWAKFVGEEGAELPWDVNLSVVTIASTEPSDRPQLIELAEGKVYVGLITVNDTKS
jgi:hypothetical protein